MAIYHQRMLRIIIFSEAAETVTRMSEYIYGCANARGMHRQIVTVMEM